jgi:ATP-dependent Clp protease ATP-binding subunit ClpC
MVEDPLSEKILYKEFRAGEIVIVDVEPDPDSEDGGKRIVFRAIEGFEPEPPALAEAGADVGPAGPPGGGPTE